MRLRLPPGLTLEMRKVFDDLNIELERLTGVNNLDFKGRRIINAGAAKDPQDYVTLVDVGKVVRAILAERDKATARARAAAAAASGGGTGGGTQPSVDLYDGFSIVEAYAAANPAQLANSCLDTGGTWDFMDGVVAALQAADSRFGFNGKRGDVNDPSEDAISYYHGDLGNMTVGSNAVYVVDIIGGHCGANPQPAWQDVTGSGGALGAWMPSRTL